jgi:undecaprenyl-phosphate 4-deoxy-4-formamido-L-arabinose transferase
MNSEDKGVLLSVVIPVYCGSETITPLVEKLITVLDQYKRCEIILVNDCSPDNSEAVCCDIAAEHPSTVRFFSLSKNVGEHNAVMAGLNKARGDWVIIMDDDFQNPVSEVEKLVNYATEHSYDVVYTKYKEKKHSSFRNWGSWFNDKVATIMLKKPKGLYLSSFKAVNRFLVDEIVKYTLPFPYIDGIIIRTTNNIGTVEVEHQERNNGRSGYTLKKLISLWLNMFTNFSILPLRVATGIGFLCAVLGFIAGIDIIIERFLNPDLPVGYAFLIFVIAMLAGTQLIAIGMVGEYLGRIFLHLNGKPQFSIRKECDFTNN